MVSFGGAGFRPGKQQKERRLLVVGVVGLEFRMKRGASSAKSSPKYLDSPLCGPLQLQSCRDPPAQSHAIRSLDAGIIRGEKGWGLLGLIQTHQATSRHPESRTVAAGQVLRQGLMELVFPQADPVLNSPPESTLQHSLQFLIVVHGGFGVRFGGSFDASSYCLSDRHLGFDGFAAMRFSFHFMAASSDGQGPFRSLNGWRAREVGAQEWTVNQLFFNLASPFQQAPGLDLLVWNTPLTHHTSIPQPASSREPASVTGSSEPSAKQLSHGSAQVGVWLLTGLSVR